MHAPELALTSRASGLATHLLSREAMEHLVRSADLPSLARALAQAGFEPAGEAPTLASLQQAVRRTTARMLTTLRRYTGRGDGVLDVFDAVLERRALRALLRGAFQGAPAEARLEGLLPTPGLPERVLTELAHQPTPGAVTNLLLVFGHPDASRLLLVTQPAQPVLFDVDHALLEGFAARATRAARRGDAVLREYVGTRLDLGNVQNALLLAEGPRDVNARRAFVRGGCLVGEDAFVEAATATSRAAAFEVLRDTFASTPLHGLFRVGAEDAASLERAFLGHELRRLAEQQHRQPLSSATVLRTLVRLDAQSRDLRTAAFGVVTHAPAALLLKELVTPWS